LVSADVQQTCIKVLHMWKNESAKPIITAVQKKKYFCKQAQEKTVWLY
jgi:hypothetical protein